MILLEPQIVQIHSHREQKAKTRCKCLAARALPDLEAALKLCCKRTSLVWLGAVAPVARTDVPVAIFCNSIQLPPIACRYHRNQTVKQV